MSLKNQWLFNIIMVVLMWLSLPLLGVRNIKRYFPASILILLVHFIDALNGKKRKWWFFYNKPRSYISGEFPYHIGPFLIGSMWILKWTYGNFKRFIWLNSIVDASFAFPIMSLLKKLKIVTLVQLNHFQFFLYLFYKAFLLYGFQYFFENKNKILKQSVL